MLIARTVREWGKRKTVRLRCGVYKLTILSVSAPRSVAGVLLAEFCAKSGQVEGKMKK